MTTRHSLLDNKVQLYMRPNSPHWQCACSIAGKQRRTSTKEESLSRAKVVARDWYLGLMGKYRAGELKEGVTFRTAAEHFVKEFEVITEGERSKEYIKSLSISLNVHLLPFMGDRVVTEITPGLVQEYRVHRMTSRIDKKTGLPKRPSRSTMHHEIIAMRHVLKTANRHGWLPYLPDISAPYKMSGKIAHRAWFSPEEYKTFYKATGERAKNPKKERWRSACEDLHDYVLFMVNSGLCPDEAKRIEIRDIDIVADGPGQEEILHIAVRGKRGVGYCKTMPGAVIPFKRMKERHSLAPNQLLFPKIQRELFNTLLDELGMKHDREGNPRTSYAFGTPISASDSWRVPTFIRSPRTAAPALR